MPESFSIVNQPFTEEELARIDPRIRKAMQGWRMTTTYKGSKVSIPDTWNSTIYPYKYFECYKKPDTKNNPGESENEIMCYMSGGWMGMDDEVVIVLMILTQDRIDDPDAEVVAEIYRFSSGNYKVYRHNKLITDFTQKFWYFFKRKVGKVVKVIK